MPLRPYFIACPAALLLGLAGAQSGAGEGGRDDAGGVDFTRDVRPIFAAHCYRCHGPEKQKGGLRLDRRRGVLEGELAVVEPGDPAQSYLFELVTSTDDDERMPSGEDPLGPEELATLERWIAAGAEWPLAADSAAETVRHWAYVPPVQPDLPEVRAAEWLRTPIDSFVLARLEAEGLAPSPEADRATLARRLALDLIGLPPTPEEVDAFIADEGDGAYGRLVDRLLASPHYGEHRARLWLDLARYADSHGYEKDEPRTMWRYRDWVIEAYNRDLPFDEFTIEQLAGDLLPEPTLDQRIATGFHRNTMVNEEGGIDPEEFRVAAVIDRVNTTAAVWLGTTLQCAQCHDHKYDPFTQKDYYQLFAFFNGTEDVGVAPMIPAPTAEQAMELERLAGRVRELEAEAAAPDAELDQAQASWEAELALALPAPPEWRALEVLEATSARGATLERADDGSILVAGPNLATDTYDLVLRPGAGSITALRLEALPHSSLPGGGPGRADDANFVLTGITVELENPGDGSAPRPLALAGATADHQQPGGFLAARAIDGDPETGWAVGGKAMGEPREAMFALAAPVLVTDGTRLHVRLAFESRFAGSGLGRFRFSSTDDARFAAGLALPAMGPWSSVGPFPIEQGPVAHATPFAPEIETTTGRPFTDHYGDGTLAWDVRDEWRDGELHELRDVKGVTYLRRTIESDRSRSLTLHFGSGDSFKAWLNGELVGASDAARDAAADQDRIRVRLTPGENRLLVKVVNHRGTSGFWFDASPLADGGLTHALARVLFTPDERRTATERAALRDHYRSIVSDHGRALLTKLAAARAARISFEAELPTTLVMRERAEPRPTHVHRRGNFLAHGERVERDVPAALPPLPVGVRRDRLALARWLVDEGNPLTARVTANRIWAGIFGIGLVATGDDFGSRGDAPSHPELLDWLATELTHRAWSVKSFLKLLVTSAVYRQSSRITPALLARDPANRLLARGPRMRVDIEVVRDNALAIAGILARDIGGPSLFPHQPEGTWVAAYSAAVWRSIRDEHLWRRGLYTFWRRTAPYPTFIMFDAPSREVVCTRRNRSNTPLQALALLNDPAFVEAAAGLARRLLREAGPEPAARIERGFRLCVARPPRPEELTVLLELYEREREHFRGDADAARRLASVSDVLPHGDDPAELAAWTMVANVLLNLDETITKN